MPLPPAPGAFDMEPDSPQLTPRGGAISMQPSDSPAVETDRVDFQTRFDVVVLDIDEAQELKQRAAQAGADGVVRAIEAGIEGRRPVVLAQDDEAKTLEVLTDWLQDVGEDSVSSGLRELRATLALDHEVEDLGA